MDDLWGHLSLRVGVEWSLPASHKVERMEREGFSPYKSPTYAVWGTYFFQYTPSFSVCCLLTATLVANPGSPLPPEGLEGETGWHCTK